MRLEELKMHENMRVSANIDAQRVPGGLIYWYMIEGRRHDSAVAVSGVFVHFNAFIIPDKEYY